MTPLLRSFRRLLAQPDFVVVFLLLGISALSLNFATDYLKLHFRKRPVAMRVAWDAADGIPASMGHWVQVSKDKPLDPDTEHILGTGKYLYREYANRDVLGDQAVESLRNLSGDQSAAALSQVQLAHPEAVIHVGITYYTGLVDTVAHIPDRCYIGDGFDVSTYTTEADQKVGAYADGSARVLTFRFINFDDQTGRGRVGRNVAYLFHVNGHYESDPLGVRRSLQNLLEPYGYYAKVELMTVSPSSSALGSTQQQAVQAHSLSAMEDFFAALLPEVERCLPDWQQVHARGAR